MCRDEKESRLAWRGRPQPTAALAGAGVRLPAGNGCRAGWGGMAPIVFPENRVPAERMGSSARQPVARWLRRIDLSAALTLPGQGAGYSLKFAKRS
jgi:hypothetical protein